MLKRLTVLEGTEMDEFGSRVKAGFDCLRIAK